MKRSLRSAKVYPDIEVSISSVTHPSNEDVNKHHMSSPPYQKQVSEVFSINTQDIFSHVPRVKRIISLPDRLSIERQSSTLHNGNNLLSMSTGDKDSLVVPSLNDVSDFGRQRFSNRSQAYSAKTYADNRCSTDNSTPGSSLFSSKSYSQEHLSLPDVEHDETQSQEMIVHYHSEIDIEKNFAISLPEIKSVCSTQSNPDVWCTHNFDNTSLNAMSHSVSRNSLSNISESLGERMHELIRAFSSRTQRTKERISQPPTPSSSCSLEESSSAQLADEEHHVSRENQLGSFSSVESRGSEHESDLGQSSVGVGRCLRWRKKILFFGTMESYSKLYVTWLFLVMLCYLYNSTVIPLRAVFPYQTRANWSYWLLADYFSDLIYIVDVVVFKTRLRFTSNGCVETKFQQTKKHYFRKWMFKFDVLSLLPLDLFYFYVDQPWTRKWVWLRLPRVLKIQTFREFYARCDQAAKSSAHAIRIVKTMTYMLYLVHIETCGYYAVSEYEGLNSNRWVYNNQGNAYIRCFYLATKTATSIGNNPKPTNQLEYMFMTLYWLSGVFVFALLIGQIKDIVEAASMVKENYHKKMNSVLHYMQSANISEDIQERAKKWFIYNWEQSKTFDERSLVAPLPSKLQTDLAIGVHFSTLNKVQLFQDCEKNLLYDLVLKLKPNLFLPGDYVCHKGEVGKEMYIVSQGHVEVIGGVNNELVLATLSEGSVFGEISLLAMTDRGNRRTASVRSSGYTNVFTLSKCDFEEAMNEYPDAQKLLKKRAKELLKENAKKIEQKGKEIVAEEIIRAAADTPKMVNAVIQVLKPESQTARKLTSSKRREAGGEGAFRHHLNVPGLSYKPSSEDRSQDKLAFELNHKQVRPDAGTLFDEHSWSMDVNHLALRNAASQPNHNETMSLTGDIPHHDNFSVGSMIDGWKENASWVRDVVVEDTVGELKHGGQREAQKQFETQFFESVINELWMQDVAGVKEEMGEQCINWNHDSQADHSLTSPAGVDTDTGALLPQQHQGEKRIQNLGLMVTNTSEEDGCSTDHWKQRQKSPIGNRNICRKISTVSIPHLETQSEANNVKATADNDHPPCASILSSSCASILNSPCASILNSPFPTLQHKDTECSSCSVNDGLAERLDSPVSAGSEVSVSWSLSPSQETGDVAVIQRETITLRTPTATLGQPSPDAAVTSLASSAPAVDCEHAPTRNRLPCELSDMRETIV